MKDHVIDARGNRCDVAYFGTLEAAQAALDSLKDCDNCINCSRCSGCSNIANLYNKQNLKGDPDSAWTGAPPIPIIPDIHKVIYEAVTQPGALEMGSWHTCDTTHCRGGWVVTKAGDAGRALEQFHNTALAAQLIYEASGYKINPCRFYDGNMAAMEHMKRLAEEGPEPERVV